MNYILIMTEGSDEKAFIELLIERGLLKFTKEDLLMEEVYHARQITGRVASDIKMLPQGDCVDIYRFGDKMSDELKIPKDIIKGKIREKHKICILPEFEMLFILNEGLYDEFIKNKSKMQPNSFYKSKHKGYSKQASYITEYFENMTNDEIIDLFNLYKKKRGKVHKENQESYLTVLK